MVPTVQGMDQDCVNKKLIVNMMFKFFRELWSGARKGLDEAKEEMAHNAVLAAHDSAKIVDQKLLKTVPYAEQFGTALGAPFRTIVFGDWFTVFGSKNDDGTYPVHLYQFGDYPKQPEYQSEFLKLLKRDFGIEDAGSCLAVLAFYFNLLDIPASGTALKSASEQISPAMWDIRKPGADALAIAVASHLITAATDAGLLSKSAALTMLEKLSDCAGLRFNSWETYSQCFLEGENNVGLNNKIGRSYLKRYIGYLRGKVGSPWNNVRWIERPMSGYR